MTHKVFWEDPYLTKLKTTVRSSQGNQVTLNETIFYAFSGGQESDSGQIDDYQVLKADKRGKTIVYTLEDNHRLKENDSVTINIDWNRRYKLMRLHFAAELVLELVCKRFPDVIKVGAHIAQEKARIDFKWDQKISPFLESIRKEAQEVIDSDLKIISAFSDESNERRYWKIPNLASVPCGGTHIRSTKEVGILKLKRSNPGKGKERIEIFVNEDLGDNHAI